MVTNFLKKKLYWTKYPLPFYLCQPWVLRLILQKHQLLQDQEELVIGIL